MRNSHTHSLTIAIKNTEQVSTVVYASSILTLSLLLTSIPFFPYLLSTIPILNGNAGTNVKSKVFVSNSNIDLFRFALTFYLEW